MNFDLYKNRLKEYLAHKGVDVSKSPTHCFNSGAHRHGDATPSCQLWKDSFKCHGCGITGDIYDAVGLLEDITDKKAQFEFVEKFFGGARDAAAAPRSTGEDFAPDAAAMRVFEDYLAKNPQAQGKIRAFLRERAQASVPSASAYPVGVEEYILSKLFYWPGLAEAKKHLSAALLKNCGIPLVHPTTGHSTWESPGVVMKLGTGYKLHYYRAGSCNTCPKISGCPQAAENGSCKTCEKRTSKGGKTFPMPGGVNPALPAILVEGEMNALSSAAIGIPNVFATGGVNGLTKPKVIQHLLCVPEIILFFDSDKAGRKASGLEPLDETDKRKHNIPQIIRSAGYTGTIKMAELPPPDVTGYKDQDGLIIAGKREVILDALAAAREWTPQKPKKTYTQFEKYNELSIKRLRCLLRKINIQQLGPFDLAMFYSACIQVFPQAEARKRLLEWGADEKDFVIDRNISPYCILDIIEPHISKYILREVKYGLTPMDEPPKSIRILNTEYTLDYDEIEINHHAHNFIHDASMRSAALLLADILDENMIYNDAKNDKHFYFFNGHIWEHMPGISGVASDALHAVIQYFGQKKDEDGNETAPDNKKLHRLKDKIDPDHIRLAIAREFGTLKAEGVYHNTDDKSDPLHFDGDLIRETLTLADCVMDFSGSELVFRKSRKEEYRKAFLPYTEAQTRNAADAFFWKFMRGNFRNEDTLETLMYYLSLIGSRTHYKYGAFFIGDKNTGKTATIRMIQNTYTDLTTTLPPDELVPKGKGFSNANGPTPNLAKLPGLCAAITSETEDGAKLNAAIWKRLTGGDTLSARGLNEAPKEFVNTAQIIISTNVLPRFDRHDEAVLERMVVIPFLVQHGRRDSDTMLPDDITRALAPELPAIIRILAEYYVRLKTEHRGIIPVSEESLMHKSEAISEVESALDKYLKENIVFDENSMVRTRDVYNDYVRYFDLDENDAKRGEALSHQRCTAVILKNYKKNHVTASRQRIGGESARVFIGMRLKTQDELFGGAPLPAASPPEPGDEANPFN
ncbi:MAG: toprim domain-containing protein [Spirochaetota bacterium]|jgi:hypothetical protein|nr:toprim domain-containing protein [Spirochaetota bacterium]